MRVAVGGYLVTANTFATQRTVGAISAFDGFR